MQELSVAFLDKAPKGHLSIIVRVRAAGELIAHRVGYIIPYFIT
jgi:hypothetical protein